MSCTNLSGDSRKSIPDRLTGLCTVCQKLDFVLLTNKACGFCDGDSHLHIGTLKNMARKVFCPGCRLILSAAQSTDLSLYASDETTVTIRRKSLWADFHDQNPALPETLESEDEWKLPEHMDCFIEVIFDAIDSPFGTSSNESKVAGTIIKAEEAELADSTGRKTTTFKLRMPLIRGRGVLPEVDTRAIKQWMQCCSARHDSCRLPAIAIAKEPHIRLIDVHDNRIVPSVSAEKYVALSNVWGSTTMPSLTKSMISYCYSLGGLNDMMIPRTILDAIQLVMAIGRWYLWVDSLCIIQDDVNDKQQQLTLMDSIYASAELVIVTAAGRDANAGLPGIRNTPRCIRQQIEKSRERISSQPSHRFSKYWTSVRETVADGRFKRRFSHGESSSLQIVWFTGVARLVHGAKTSTASLLSLG